MSEHTFAFERGDRVTDTVKGYTGVIARRVDAGDLGNVYQVFHGVDQVDYSDEGDLVLAVQE